MDTAQHCRSISSKLGELVSLIGGRPFRVDEGLRSIFPFPENDAPSGRGKWAGLLLPSKQPAAALLTAPEQVDAATDENKIDDT